jgi:predicted MPP superfamily phosphohydrolase
VTRFVQGLLFALLALSVLFGMHRYAWVRLVRDAELPPRWTRACTIAVAILGASLPPVFLFVNRLPRAERTAVAFAAYLWLGVLFYLVVIHFALELPRRLARRMRREADPVVDADRRRFLARTASGATLIGSAGLAVAGVREAREIETPTIEVRLAKLSPELSGYRIVQLSDVHLGPVLDRPFLAELVARTNALRPDLVAITGDLVDASVEVLGPELAPLRDLRARDGVVFVTGNHEYYFGADEWCAHLRSIGVRVLVNERVAIGGANGFDLAGITDPTGARALAGHAPDLERALAGRDASRALVLLAHQPRQIAATKGRGVGLQLSGHTHGGQLWPFGLLVGLFQPYVAGLHLHEGETWIYVSRGAGFWGPPMRVGNPAEIATIVLRA